MIILPAYTFLEGTEDDGKTMLYRAVRNSDRAPVLIKAPSGDPPDPREMAKLRHEYTLLKELDLPCVLQPETLEYYEGGVALVLEKPPGEPLHLLLREGKLGVREALEIAISLAGAAGLIHHRE